MKIIILVAIISVLAEATFADSILGGPDGQKQEVPAGPPGQMKVETRANEQGQPQQLKLETSAREQGQPQQKVETSARQQGPPGAGPPGVMQGKQEFTGDGAKVENVFNDQEGNAEAENNRVLEDLANANQFGLIRWPYGRFAVPRPASGCPFGWSTGTRFQDNEDDRNINSESTGIVTRMNVGVGTNLRMNYCVKSTSGSGSWPRGRYCIARKGGTCPSGFSSGSVYWDDEDNANINYYSGTLPDGVYNRNTKIYFCCRSDGSTLTAISLPTSTPFYLYRFGTSCQRVSGMSFYEDYIFTDDEDNANANSCSGSHPAGSCGGNIRINLCYYYKYY